ncbi:MAG: hypothetical protein QM765_15750 [Myxococcales bacterium]
MKRLKVFPLVALGACALALSTCGEEPPATVPPDATVSTADTGPGLPCTYPSDCVQGDCIASQCVKCTGSSCTNGTVCSSDLKCVRPDAGGINPGQDGGTVSTTDTGVPECVDRSTCAAGLVCKDGKCQGCLSGLECADIENCIGGKCMVTVDGGVVAFDAATVAQDAGAMPGDDAAVQPGLDSGAVVEPPDAGAGNCDPPCEADQFCLLGTCLGGSSGDGGSGCNPPCDPGAYCIFGTCIGGGGGSDGGSACNPPCENGAMCILGACIGGSGGGDGGTGGCNPPCAPGAYCIFGTCLGGGSRDGGSGCDPACDPGAYCILGTCIGGGNADGGVSCDPPCLPGQTCLFGMCLGQATVDAGVP